MGRKQPKVLLKSAVHNSLEIAGRAPASRPVGRRGLAGLWNPRSETASAHRSSHAAQTLNITTGSYEGRNALRTTLIAQCRLQRSPKPLEIDRPFISLQKEGGGGGTRRRQATPRSGRPNRFAGLIVNTSSFNLLSKKLSGRTA